MGTEEPSLTHSQSEGTERIGCCRRYKFCRDLRRTLWGIQGKVIFFFIVYLIIALLIIAIPGLVVTPQYLTRLEEEYALGTLRNMPVLLKTHIYQTLVCLFKGYFPLLRR